MVTKQFIAPIQDSAAGADSLEGQVPLVLDMTVHSTHTRLRRCRRPSGGAGAPGGGYDLRWQDMILRDQILEGQN